MRYERDERMDEGRREGDRGKPAPVAEVRRLTAARPRIVEQAGNYAEGEIGVVTVRRLKPAKRDARFRVKWTAVKVGVEMSAAMAMTATAATAFVARMSAKYDGLVKFRVEEEGDDI